MKLKITAQAVSLSSSLCSRAAEKPLLADQAFSIGEIDAAFQPVATGSLGKVVVMIHE